MFTSLFEVQYVHNILQKSHKTSPPKPMFVSEFIFSINALILTGYLIDVSHMTQEAP